MKNIKYLIITIGISVFSLSCEVTRLEGLQEDPSRLTPESADPEFLLNEIQFLFREMMEQMSIHTDDIMRYEAFTSTYPNLVDSDVLNGVWDDYYEALNISKTLENLATTDPNLLFHNAINKLLLGYLTVTMVDYIGNIPYSEASNPAEFQDPKLDSGTDLYIMVLSDIDQAIDDIDAALFNFSTDVFYDSDKAKWTAFANSFKLRLLIQTRLASNAIGISDLKGEINTLLGKDLIDTASEDFVWTYSEVETPESRHRYFTRGYLSGFNQYMSNYFMYMLKDSKSVRDPRLRYYIYRQSDGTPFSGPPYALCENDPTTDFCYIGESYWGLDHGDNRTGRGDQVLRSVYGIYPGGGTFDDDQFEEGKESTHINSAGAFLPILTSSFLKFLTAEAALMLGTNGNPAILLEEAIRESMDKVLNFGNVDSPLAATSTDVDDYVAVVMNTFNAAASNEEKLDIIITEYYLAAYGNSIEAYNAYRRTGYPSNMQVPIFNDNPTFPRSYPYALSEVDNNLSIEQKLNIEKVFWDTNPDGFIK